MLTAYGGVLPSSPPAPPPRYHANLGATKLPTKPSQLAASLWRESISVIFIFLTTICVTVSSLLIFYYAQRQKAVHEEIVDYLEKTVTVSQINYIPGLGRYEPRANELNTLADLRKYKTTIWAFLFSDIGCYALFAITSFIYYTSELTRMSIRFFFWFFFFASSLYTIGEASLFTAILFPQVAHLPNATEELLDHAVPFNTGGLMHMESRLGCIFDQDLYTPFKRRQNNGNTCDPYIIGSFITRTILLLLTTSRIICAILFISLVLLRTTLADALASIVMRTRPTSRYQHRYAKNPKKSKSKNDFHTPKSTTFGVNDSSSMRSLPTATPPPGKLDHSISYNNAAFFATASSGVLLDNVSDISKFEAPDYLFKSNTHTTNSLVSEV